MKHTFAMIQTQPGRDAEKNTEQILRLAGEAASLYHPGLILLPETCAWEYSAATGTDAKSRAAVSELAVSLEDPFIRRMQKLAVEYGVWLVFGILEKAADEAAYKDGQDGRCYNTVVILDDRGSIVSTYRKTHLYDAFESRESDLFIPGERLFDPVDTPFGRIGVFVCYELRFPEVARWQRARGADILLVPSAWVRGEMKSEHFKTLVTARAVENTAYVLACNKSGGLTIGESIAADPMGKVTAAADLHNDADGSGQIIPVVIDTDRIADVRKRLPSFEERRPELYS
ncbi:MAG: amidohydrolase [Lachnospiraceae bacterium]|nr:amidohydrolase [Lachnospiraceae bacterium]